MGVGCCLNIDGRVAIGRGAPYVLPFLVTSEFPLYRKAPDSPFSNAAFTKSGTVADIPFDRPFGTLSGSGSHFLLYKCH